MTANLTIGLLALILMHLNNRAGNKALTVLWGALALGHSAAAVLQVAA